MNDIQWQCVLPPSILERIGSILFVRADCPTEAAQQAGASATFNGARSHLRSLLIDNAALFLVFYSSTLSINEIEAVRRRLPEYLQCRVIGSVNYLNAAAMAWACKKWMAKFAPHLPFVILDDAMVQKMDLIKRTRREFNRSSCKDSTLKNVVGLPTSPVTNRPLCSVEMVKLALDLYMNGLPSLAHVVRQPLLDYWQLSDRPLTKNVSTIFGFGRCLAGQFGELCRRVNIQPMSHVSDTSQRHCRYDNA